MRTFQRAYRVGVARAPMGFVVAAAVALSLAACGTGENAAEEVTTATGTDGGDGGSATTEPAATTEVEPVTIRLATAVTEEGTHGESVRHFADAVSDASGGAISIEVYPSGSLLPGSDILPGVGDGRAGMGLTYNIYHPAEMPMWNVIGVPFVTDNSVATAMAFGQLYEENDALADEFAQMGVRPLFFMPSGEAAAGTTTPIDGIRDLDGMRFRAPGSMADVAEAVGVDVVFLEFAEMYEALQRGVLDGWVGTEMGAAVAAGLHEVTPHFLNPGVGQYASAAVFINSEQWEELTQGQQQVIQEVAGNYPQGLVDLIMDLEAEACETLKSEGGSVELLPEDQVQEWADAARDTVLETIRSAATDAGATQEDFDAYFARYQELVDEYEDQTEYTPALRTCANE